MASDNGRSIITNKKLPDSSSKLIFGDSILSSQFFRDYADMEILRNIRPEDIEDVSERYVPLYSTERESDTVKKVDISRYLSLDERENGLNLPLYIISLIEHKTKVDYNVVMQVLRYTVHIWEDYEKEMNAKTKGISSRKEFKYPPVLPIVYYEGAGRWTAPMDLSERILCGDLLGKYLPHFRYQLVRLHDFSNEELLAKKDEISLAMLINKIQNPEDLSSFVGVSGEQVDGILCDTPDYLLDIMAKVLRALLYSLNLPEDETEDAVSKIKERKMGRLFENVKMDIQAERRKTAEMVKEANEKVAEAEEKAAEANEKVAEVEEKLDAVTRALEVYKCVIKMLRSNKSESEIRESLMQNFSLTKEQAQEEYRKVCDEE